MSWSKDLYGWWDYTAHTSTCFKFNKIRKTLLDIIQTFWAPTDSFTCIPIFEKTNVFRNNILSRNLGLTFLKLHWNVTCTMQKSTSQTKMDGYEFYKEQQMFQLGRHSEKYHGARNLNKRRERCPRFSEFKTNIVLIQVERWHQLESFTLCLGIRNEDIFRQDFFLKNAIY